MIEQRTLGSAFDPLEDAYLRDPYPAVAALRAQTAVAYSPAVDMWVVTRYADIEAIFRDPMTFSAAVTQAPLAPVSEEARAILAGGFQPVPVLSNLDPPDHAAIRAHAVRAFSARRLAAMEPLIRERAHALIEGFAGRDRVELVRELAFPLPALTIFTMIGFPDDDMELLKSYCSERLAFTWGRPSAEDQVRVARQMVAYWKYCEDFVARRVRDPRDDFTTDLLRTAYDSPAALSERQVSSIIYGLSFAGHETTTNLIANTVRQLLEHPEAWGRICDDPSTIPAAVEEVLRFDTSVIAWRRITTRAARIGDVDVPADAKLLLLLCSANHDPARFPNPDHFDIQRKDARQHLSFGKGIHFCLGAGLARMEDAIVLELLVRRFPRLELAADQTLTFHPNVSFRGPQELWVVPRRFERPHTSRERMAVPESKHEEREVPKAPEAAESLPVSIRIRLPMRDGVRLDTSIWLPEGETAPVPAILIRSPYQEHFITAERLRQVVLQYRDVGFAVIFQIVRGVGPSEGTFTFNSALERPDGYDTVEWIAAQPWSNGAVGMDGSSYLAMMQLSAAVHQPPHLKCIVVAVPSADFFREPPYFGGCFSRQHTINWLKIIGSKSRAELTGGFVDAMPILSQPEWLNRMRSRPIIDAADGVLEGDMLAYYKDALTHSTFDDWWRERTLSADDYAKIGIPTLVVTGNFDLSIGGLTVWRGLEANAPAGAERHLLIGPWDHGQCYGGGARAYGPYDLGEESAFDLWALRREFFERHLKGEGAGVDLGARVKLFITGANAWRTFDAFPPREVNPTRLFLRSGGHANSVRGDGVLSTEAAADPEPADHFTTDPSLPFVPALTSADAALLLDLRETERNSDVLVYATEPLTDPLTILGEPDVVLHVAADVRDCDLVVRLAETRADHRTIQLCAGRLRLRYRYGFEREVPLEPNEPTEVRIAMSYVGHEIPAGSRLKLLVTGGMFPMQDPNPHTGEPIATAVESRTAEQTILHGNAHPSRIELPVLG